MASELSSRPCSVCFLGGGRETDLSPAPPRFFYQFLLGNERATAKEIRDEYVETLSKIYLSYYRSYLGRLMKVQVRPKREAFLGTWSGKRDHTWSRLDSGKKFSYHTVGRDGYQFSLIFFPSTRKLLKRMI